VEDGQAAVWSASGEEPIFALDVGATRGRVQVFGDGRVAVYDAFAPRGSRDQGMRLSSGELEDLVGLVLEWGVLRGENVEPPVPGRTSTHPTRYKLRVRLATYRDGRGGTVRPFDRAFGATNAWLGRRPDRPEWGLAAVMLSVADLARSPRLRPLVQAPARGVPDWAAGHEGPAPRIVYTVGQARGPTLLRTVDWLGAEERVLASIPAPAVELSPDGVWAAYLREGGVAVRSLVTGEERILVPGSGRAHSFLFSPDGGELAFSAEIGERYYHLFVAATDGSGWEPLTDFGAKPLAWSPDGRRVYYERFQRGVQPLGAHMVPRPNVFVVGRDGLGTEPAVRWGVWDFRLSPDGRHASYGSGDYTSHSPERVPRVEGQVRAGRGPLLWVARLDPSTGGRLKGSVGLAVADGGSARWAADGGRLLYSRGRSIEIVRSNGTGRKVLWEETVGNRSLGNLRFSPDERAILFVRRPIPSGQRLACCSEIWIMGRDGSEPRFLAEGVWAEWFEGRPAG
jgi:hypothetical protein